MEAFFSELPVVGLYSLSRALGLINKVSIDYKCSFLKPTEIPVVAADVCIPSPWKMMPIGSRI